jgi:hypothetical protein
MPIMPNVYLIRVPKAAIISSSHKMGVMISNPFPESVHKSVLWAARHVYAGWQQQRSDVLHAISFLVFFYLNQC